MKKIILILLVIFSIKCAKIAQDVSGYITDQNGNALAYVDLQLLGSQTIETKTTFSDSNGYYTFHGTTWLIFNGYSGDDNGVQLLASKPEFFDYIAEFDIRSNEPIDHNFSMVSENIVNTSQESQEADGNQPLIEDNRGNQ